MTRNDEPAADEGAARAAVTPLVVVPLVVGAVIGVVFVLHQMRPVFAPLAFALLVMALVWPLQRRLQHRMPVLLALAVCALLTFLVVTVFASLAAWAFGRIARDVAGQMATFQMLQEQAVLWLEQHGIAAGGVWGEYFNVGRLIRVVQQVLSTINSTMAFSLVVLVYVILGLLEVNAFAGRLRRMSNGGVGRALLAGIGATAAKLRRYMAVRSLMSVATGALVWGFASVAGLQHAMEWGMIAFVLNYIPFIGPFVATIFPTLFAVTQFQSWEMVVLVFVCLNLIQFLVGSYLEPRVAGNALAVSPFVVLFSVFFWTSLWGIAGAFIGVPITIALLTISGEFRSSRWVAEIFGSGPGKADRPAG